MRRSSLVAKDAVRYVCQNRPSYRSIENDAPIERMAPPSDTNASRPNVGRSPHLVNQEAWCAAGAGRLNNRSVYVE